MQIFGGSIHTIRKPQKLQQFLTVPNKEAGEEVKADKTGDTFMLRDQNSGKFTTQRYVINRLKCDSSSYIGGITITNQNCFHEEIQSRQKSGNASHNSVQDTVPSVGHPKI